MALIIPTTQKNVKSNASVRHNQTRLPSTRNKGIASRAQQRWQRVGEDLDEDDVGHRDDGTRQLNKQLRHRRQIESIIDQPAGDHHQTAQHHPPQAKRVGRVGRRQQPVRQHNTNQPGDKHGRAAELGNAAVMSPSPARFGQNAQREGQATSQWGGDQSRGD